MKRSSLETLAKKRQQVRDQLRTEAAAAEGQARDAAAEAADWETRLDALVAARQAELGAVHDAGAAQRWEALRTEQASARDDAWKTAEAAAACWKELQAQLSDAERELLAIERVIERRTDEAEQMRRHLETAENDERQLR